MRTTLHPPADVAEFPLLTELLMQYVAHQRSSDPFMCVCVCVCVCVCNGGLGLSFLNVGHHSFFGAAPQRAREAGQNIGQNGDFYHSHFFFFHFFMVTFQPSIFF